MVSNYSLVIYLCINISSVLKPGRSGPHSNNTVYVAGSERFTYIEVANSQRSRRPPPSIRIGKV